MSYVLCELIVKEKFKKERKNIDSAEIKKRIRYPNPFHPPHYYPFKKKQKAEKRVLLNYELCPHSAQE